MKIINYLFICIFLIVSCSNNKSTTTEKTMNIIHVTESAGIEDDSFNFIINKGIKKFMNENSNINYSILISNNNDTILQTLKQAIDQKPDLIIAAGYNFEYYINELAYVDKNIHFLLVDGDVKKDNVKCILFDEDQAGYLTGLNISKYIKDNNIKSDNLVFGLIIGMDVPATSNYAKGFKSGIKVFNPKARFKEYVLNNWNDTALSKTVSKLWYDNYKDDLFSIMTMAGSANNGPISLSKELYLQNKPYFYIIGVDFDIYDSGFVGDGNIVLTSALKNIDVAVYDTLNELKKGSFGTGIFYYNENNNGIGFSIKNPIFSNQNN